MKHRYRFPIRLHMAMALFAASTASTEPDSRAVPASLTFKGGQRRQYDLAAGATLKIKTSVGTLAFDCSEIVSIDHSDSAELATVTLTSGERWRSNLGDGIPRAIGLKDADKDVERYGEVRRADFPHPITHADLPAHYLKLLLEDGSQSFIDPAGISIAVETAHSKLDLPIGALRALRFLFSTDGDDPDLVLVRFPTGRVERLGLRSRSSYLRGRDCRGNQFKARHRDIMGILSPVDTAQTGASEESGLPKRDYISTRDGKTKSVFLPLSVWNLRTEIGDVSLPSPLVRTIKRMPDSPREVELRTIFGEILRGKLTTRKLLVLPEPDDEHSAIDVDEVDKLRTSSPSLRIPDEWMVFYLKSGQALIGRLADTPTGLVSAMDKPIIGNTVYSLTPTPEDTFVVASKQGRVGTCRTETRDVNVVLLSNGSKISIPWKDIHLAKTQRSVEESSLRNAVLGQEVSEAAAGSNAGISTAVAKDKTLRLDTAIGALSLLPETVARVSVDRSLSQACITTVYGDILLTSIPSRKWFGRLNDDENYELPQEDTFTVTLRGVEKPEPSGTSIRCRLRSGDIFVGTLPKQELTIRQKGSPNKTTAIADTDLSGIRRNEDGDLVFQLSRGASVTGAPKGSNMAIELLSSGIEEQLPFRDIETLVVGSTELPPTTVFAPGLPADLTDEILVDGGSFNQGSGSGMDDEGPVHRVSLSSFFMDATEVTKAQFAAFVLDTKHETAAEQSGSATTWRTPGFGQRDDDPAVCISWNDAIAYCNWRSKQARLDPCYSINKADPVATDLNAAGYRLPTEAEWEYAARSKGNDHPYPWGSVAGPEAAQSANYRQRDNEVNDSWAWTCPVRTFPKNDLGIYGLGGNVWEWCEDWYFDRAYFALQNRTAHNPCITQDRYPPLTRRVMRGGSFRNGIDLLLCTARGNGLPYAFANHVGFRCVRNAE